MLNFTETDIDEDVDIMLDKLFTKQIVVYNDDVNTFEHVIACLMKYLKHTPEQAEQCAWIIHQNGKCSVKNGTYEELLPMNTALTDQGLSSVIE